MGIAIIVLVACAVLADAPGTRFGASMAVVKHAESGQPWAVAVGAPGRLDMPGTVWLLPTAGGGPIWRSEGIRPGARFGFAIASIGDLDDDGVTDLLIGAPEEGGRGAVHVLSGRTGVKLLSVTGKANGDRFGYCLASGSASGSADGLLWIAGAPQTGGSRQALGAGYVRLFAGLDSAVLRELSGPSPGSGFGFAAKIGIAERQGPFIAVGAPFYSQGDANRVGYVSCFWLTGDVAEERLVGYAPDMQFGYALDLVNDLEGRARHLVIASSYNEFSDARSSAVSLVSMDSMETLWSIAAGDTERALGAALASVSNTDSAGLKSRLFASTPAGGRAQCEGYVSEAGALIELDVETGVRKSRLQPIGSLCQHHLGGTYGHGPLPFATFILGGSDFDGDLQSDLLIGSPDVFGSGEVWVYSPAKSRILIRWSEWEVLGQNSGTSK